MMTNSWGMVRCYEAFFHKQRYWIFMDFMDGGAFTDMVEDLNGNVSEEFCKYSLKMAFTGLLELHRRNIIHRDIKSDNILIKGNGDIKLGDFGYAVVLTQQQKVRKSTVGTSCWMAPELIIKDRTYNEKVDIWSMGIFAMELATG